MYDYFNRGCLAARCDLCDLELRARGQHARFLAPERRRWEHGTATTHEISLNPAHLASRSARDIASTLVHMVHCWQQEQGTPSARGYHNKEWAKKMDARLV